jgi:hypothetical protein
MRLTYGLTSSLSLAVNYSFTMQEMRSATFSPSGLSEAMKTAFHEVVHVYQMTGTSYGYYCQLLRDFQINQTLLIVDSIRTYYQAAPRLPVARQVLALPDEPAANTIRQLLRAWFLADSVLLWFEGDTDAFTVSALSIGKVFRPHPLIAMFTELNWWLTWFVRETERAQLPEPDQRLVLAHSEGELVKRENNYLAMKILLDQDTAGVLESAARAAEYWGQSGPVSPAMLGAKGADSGIPRHLIRYASALQRATHHLPTDDVHTFALTYGIIADLVLNAPLLPHHASFRTADTVIADLDPGSRLLKALSASARIPPVSDLSAAEYTRFAGELCAACDWPTPGDLGSATLSVLPEQPHDYFTRLYRLALELRGQFPQIFNDLSVQYRPKTPVTDKFTYYFTHPVIQFSDTARLHNDQAMVQFFVHQAMLRDYLRRILLSQDPTVTLPYAADEEEIAAWRGLLSETLSEVGFNNPRLTVLPGPVRPPH